MSIERLVKAYELEKRVLGAGERKCPVPAIEAAEKELGVVFPPTYRHYLEHIHLNTKTSIFGVEVDEGGGLKETSSVFVTFDLRDGQDLPENYVLIDQDGDFQHVVDTEVNEAGESPVLYWWDEDSNSVIYPDFDGFYLERVSGAIYLFMLEKAEEEGLSKTELEAYFQLHSSLGFTDAEHKFLKRHWEILRSKAK